MDSKTFQEQVSRLKRTYGQDSYPQACVESLWDELKHVPDRKFVKAINRVLANNPNPRFPPGIEEIEKKLATIHEEDWEEKKLNYREEVNKAFPSRSASKDEMEKLLSEMLSIPAIRNSR